MIERAIGFLVFCVAAGAQAQGVEMFTGFGTMTMTESGRAVSRLGAAESAFVLTMEGTALPTAEWLGSGGPVTWTVGDAAYLGESVFGSIAVRKFRGGFLRVLENDEVLLDGVLVGETIAVWRYDVLRGSLQGEVEFLTGLDIDDLPAWGGWTLGASLLMSGDPTGFSANVDGAIVVLVGSVVAERSWGGVKALYR